jgi:hypothetical protein
MSEGDAHVPRVPAQLNIGKRETYLREFLSLLETTRDEVVRDFARMRARLADPDRFEREEGEFFLHIAGGVAPGWKPRGAEEVELAERARRDLGITRRKAKQQAILAALAEVWYMEPLSTWTHGPGAGLDRLVRRVRARVKQAVAEARAPDAEQVPLGEGLATPPPARWYPRKVFPPLATLLAPLPKAERAFVDHLRSEPDLSNADRDRVLGRKPGYSRQMFGRLRRRLAP